MRKGKMKILRVLIAAWCVMSAAPPAGAETLEFTGTFAGYKLVGVAVPLNGVGRRLTTWPAYDANLSDAGVQELIFDVVGTITTDEDGVVTGAVIKQASPLVLDTAGASGYTRSTFNGISWTYTGGTTLALTPGNGSKVTGSCQTIVPAGSGQCALQLADLQSGSENSVWQWSGIAPNFTVSDLFGGSGISNVDVGGPAGHPGVSWTVEGDSVTAVVTRGLANPNPNLNTAYQGRFDLQTIPAGSANAADDGPIFVLAEVPVEIDVLANDTGFTDPVTVTLADLPGKGTAGVINSPGPKTDIRIVYTGSSGSSGTDTFTYEVDDGDDSDIATVTIDIVEIGANDDTASTTRNTPVDIAVGANDLGFDGPVTVVVNNGSFTAGGSASVTSGQGGPSTGVVIRYVPVSAPGTPTYQETFTYTVSDGLMPPDTATVKVTVSNAVPLAVDGTIDSIATVGVDPATQTGAFSVLATGGNLGNSGVVTISGPPQKGTAAVAGSVITYSPGNSYFSGQDSFVYTITDADGEVSSATVSVNIANAVPAIPDSRIRTSQDSTSGPLNPGVTPGNGTLAQHALAVTTQAQFGTCSVSTGTAAGTVTYTPDAGFFGADSCVLTVTDGDGSTDTATVTVTVDQVFNTDLSDGSSAVDPWLLSILAGVLVWRRRRLT
jgi:hypothetical protein